MVVGGGCRLWWLLVVAGYSCLLWLLVVVGGCGWWLWLLVVVVGGGGGCWWWVLVVTLMTFKGLLGFCGVAVWFLQNGNKNFALFYLHVLKNLLPRTRCSYVLLCFMTQFCMTVIGFYINSFLDKEFLN